MNMDTERTIDIPEKRNSRGRLLASMACSWPQLDKIITKSMMVKIC